jgi:hypothetical protein
MILGLWAAARRRASLIESWGAVIIEGVVTLRATAWLEFGSLAL